MECKEWSVKMWSVKCGVNSVDCKVGGVKCGECRVWSVKCRVRLALRIESWGREARMITAWLIANVAYS